MHMGHSHSAIVDSYPCYGICIKNMHIDISACDTVETNTFRYSSQYCKGCGFNQLLVYMQLYLFEMVHG